MGKPVWNNTDDYKKLLLLIAFSKAIGKADVDCRAVYTVTWIEDGVFFRCLDTERGLKHGTPGQWEYQRFTEGCIPSQCWNYTLRLSFVPKKKSLKVPLFPHSPGNKMGVEWFHLVGIGWSLISAEAVGWQLLSDLWLFFRKTGNARSGLPWILGSGRVSQDFCVPMWETKL